MKLHLCAIGRLRKGPEKALIDDYLDRAGKTGRALGLGPCTVSEAEAKRGGGMAEEADLLARMIPDGAKLVCLDERGKLLSSPQLADQLGAWRDEGIRDTAFVIGGADGIDPTLRARADLSISFGKMVWPHMLARVMLSEQIYRATTILAGSPYHRV
ncbi:Ribosomal RNA large subunit methyltransferase H [Pseudooceanicola marinus]|uniref:Ribosomal RNA large subunit methyltransferase H n=1 Tax=Pseudooceanicola marinus TaxID=396013 RepID=A0A1X6ZIA6_9RHOB|nr:23S rRNA (pseudouridine(1915)-N(3))-methyltransferase RlmH [Pseudooceanicola marinus]PJE31505.1 23S rRNA (pseudouridine(1915)-N(3))-methyltransferase RlmH [Pseudooceanicola marinus]SLN52344.1 Ribosomal RNA large subunit methyltransferase H [Pseudooceanicola marinus]